MIVTMIVVMIKICVSSSIGNYKLTPTTFCNVDLADHVILNKQVALKVATLHKIKDPYVSKNLKREPAIMAKLNHPIAVSLEEVVSVVYYYAWSSTLSLGGDLGDTLGSERIERFELHEEQVLLQLSSSVL